MPPLADILKGLFNTRARLPRHSMARPPSTRIPASCPNTSHVASSLCNNSDSRPFLKPFPLSMDTLKRPTYSHRKASEGFRALLISTKLSKQHYSRNPRKRARRFPIPPRQTTSSLVPQDTTNSSDLCRNRWPMSSLRPPLASRRMACNSQQNQNPSRRRLATLPRLLGPQHIRLPWPRRFLNPQHLVRRRRWLTLRPRSESG